MERFATGGERDVFVSPDNENKLIKRTREEKISSPELAKANFYMGKILHMLFPKNIPDIYYAKSGKADVNEYGDTTEDEIHVERILLDEDSDNLRRSNIEDKANKDMHEEKARIMEKVRNHPQFKSLSDSLSALKLSPDRDARNWSIDSEGNLKYLDSDIFKPWPRSDLKRYPDDLAFVRSMLATIEDRINNSLEGAEKDKATAYLDRVKELLEQQLGT